MRLQRARRGFTLIELMMVVAILGVLAALSIFGVRRYLAASKVAEAKQTIGGISRGIALLNERAGKSQLLAKGSYSDPIEQFWCPECTGAKLCVAPQIIPPAKKYQPDNNAGNDFDACCWRCIRFTLDSPTYFQYRYSIAENYIGPAVGGPDPGGTGVEIGAQGDLNGNGLPSTMTLTATVDPTTNDLQFATQLFIYQEYE